jgi:antitoxin VapB
MALHIRQDETEKLARQLARRTGETLTAAVHEALKERLERLKLSDRKEEERFLAKLREISDRSAAAFRASGEKRSGQELLDELYDENGLPR